MPTYRRPALVRRCVESALGSSGADFEVVVSDNGPDDAAQELLAALGDPRLRHWRNETNIGPDRNILKLLSSARGDWVLCMTDDDYLLPGGLERLIAVADEHPEAGVILSTLQLVDEARNPQSLYRFHDRTEQVPAGMPSLSRFVRAAHVFSGLTVRREWMDLVGMERHLASMYPQMYLVGAILKQHPAFYLDAPVVGHTVGNQVFWDYPADYMVGTRVALFKDLLPLPRWRRERAVLMGQLIDEIYRHHMRLTWYRGKAEWLRHQRTLLRQPDIAASPRYWARAAQFLVERAVAIGRDVARRGWRPAT